MKGGTAALLLLLCALPARGQVDDPLKSAACGQALAQLQSARQQDATQAATQALRGEAAVACLGTATPASRAGRSVQAPQVVPAPRIDVPPRAAPLPPVPAPPAPVAIERAPLPAQCDAGGCWSSDGTHLRHVPGGLLGPGGLCTQQAGQLLCP